MTDEELIPWSTLSGQPTPGLRRIALMLMAPLVDEEEKPTDKYAWGKAGLAIGREILSYCDHADGKKRKKDVLLEKKEQKKQGDPRHPQAQEIVRCFDATCRKELNAPPAKFNWGYATKQTYGLLSDGWDPELLRKLIPLFFDCRRDKGWLFRSGAFSDFVNGVLNLKTLHDATQPAIKRPASLS